MSIDLKSGLSRKGASQRLWTEYRLSYTEATLANMATDGGGPVYRIVGGRAIYMPADADARRYDAALAELMEARWLVPSPSREGGTIGRRRKTFYVTPRLYVLLDHQRDE